MIPSTAVIETVAIAKDRDPTTLEPFSETIDPDALDALVDPSEFHSTDGDTSVSFVFAGHVVTVQNNGTGIVQPDQSRHASD